MSLTTSSRKFPGFTPTRPWENLVIDLCNLNGKEWFIIFGCFSFFSEVNTWASLFIRVTYQSIVFTKSMDSNFRAFCLDAVTLNILGYSLFWDGIQNGFSFRDSFERWNFSAKWIEAVAPTNTRKEAKFVLFVFTGRRKTFSYWICNKIIKMSPETLSIET